jgi:glucosamine--fructose-6-phosphate aminotransferase (isomerizing)
MMDKSAAGAQMQAEIREQPEAIRRLLAAETARVWELGERWSRRLPRFIAIAARGTSDHAALYGKYLFETINHIFVGLAAPSISSIYHAEVKLDDALVVGISQSGEAADVIAVLENARHSGAQTLAITNVGTSPLAAMAETTIELHANPELAVAATKTFTTTMATLLLLSAAMRHDTALLESLQGLPEIIADVLAQEAAIRAKVERFRFLEECVVLGRGYNLATAYELALKMRETSYIRAQPFASPDFVHGPIAILDEGYPVIAFANDGPTLPSVLEVLKAAKARGAETVVFGNALAALDIADVAIPLNQGLDVPEVLSPYPSIVAGQIFACTLATLKGFNPDAPRGLRKVTITR